MRALGLMSGTSLDGVDAAVLETDGVAIETFGPSLSRPYGAEARDVLRGAFGWAPAEEAEVLVDRLHIEAARAFAGGLDVVGYHGQTVAHDPARGRTRQLGDGAALALAVGARVVWDFRSQDMRAGGQGAPLAPFFHWACARWADLEGPVAFLNLGGVGNVTWVDPDASAPEAPGALLAFDTGPGNALLDDFMLARTGRAMDEGGASGAAGLVAEEALSALATSSYVSAAPPKSLDRQDFAAFGSLVDGMSTEDGAATLTALTAESVRLGAALLPSSPKRWLVTGGGRRNPTMMAMLADRLAAPVDPVEAVGLDGDMLEAQAFAYLAVRRLRGLPNSAPGTTGCRAPVVGGRVSPSP